MLKAIGLTVSNASRAMMVKSAREKALPSEPLVPNDEINEAMNSANGRLSRLSRQARSDPDLPQAGRTSLKRGRLGSHSEPGR